MLVSSFTVAELSVKLDEVRDSLTLSDGVAEPINEGSQVVFHALVLGIL